MVITRGYKQGRAVMFYDIADSNGTREKVSKDEVVALCNENKIENASVQMWEGKPIVRCKNKQLPLLRVDENGNVIGEATKTVRNRQGSNSVNVRVEMPLQQGVTVGQISNKKPKLNIKFSGYSSDNLQDKYKAEQSLNISGIDTLEDLFRFMADDFGIKDTDIYINELGKKIKLNRKVSSLPTQELRALNSSVATYLMNMKYDEIAKTMLKYSSTTVLCTEEVR